MKRYPVRIAALLCAACITTTAFTQASWQPKNLRLATRWTNVVSPENALKEYPRPQFVRPQWTNLNGLWDYAITDTAEGREEKGEVFVQKYEEKILVPYPIESALSGVQKMLRPDQYLWYRKSVNISRQPGKKTILHFGAVDNEASVFVNGKFVGSHKGGYTAFSFDITPALKNGENEVVVKVYDPTDQGIYPHGKQVSSPANIYYTPSSGIWQTVWLEEIPVNFIKDLQLTPDIDSKKLTVVVNGPKGYSVKLTAFDNTNAVSESQGKTNEKISLPIYDAKLWSPAFPFLYDLKVQLLKGNKLIDEVSSYFGMRKVSVDKDDKGFPRIFLNNQYVYNLGVLDQGFWPDGLYTAPTDEALRFDIEAIKSMGFNTIRKHIKAEPARWYHHADKLGMLVWQDFVNPNQSLPGGAKPAFEQQLNETMDQLYNHPCVTTWVLFNERWGAYDQQRLTEMVKRKDPSRLINAHSGELLWVNEKLRAPADNPWPSSDLADIHSYPDPMNVPGDKASNKVRILGEFGGIGVFIPDHQWLSNKSWGYVQVTSSQLLGKYSIMNQHLQLLEREGLAGSIYTQPFDVEGEENGLMTYDRAVIKMPFDALRKIHAPLNPNTGPLPEVALQNADLTDPGLQYSRLLQLYIDGKRDAHFLKKLSMTAAQFGDKNGVKRIGSDFVASLNASSLTEDDAKMIADMTTSTKDAGFALMNTQPDLFRKTLGDRPYTLKLMNLIYTGEMKPLIENIESPDWTTIETRTKEFGAPGEEIYLRAKTIHFYNAQDWPNYATVAKVYLDRYGTNLPDNERKMFTEALANGSANTK